MKVINFRKVAWGLTIAWLVGMLSMLFGIRIFAAEAVSVDFVNSKEFTHSGEKAPDQTDYLYFDNDIGGWVEFTIPEIQPGEYDVSVVYKTHNNCGVFQTYVDGNTVGEPVDQNGNNSGDLTKQLGTVTIEEADAHTVRLVAQENSYEKYRITVKSITLAPVVEEEPDKEKPIPEVEFGQKEVSASGNVEAWPMPYVYEESADFTVTADGTNVPVTKYFGWYDYANFSMKGKDNGGDTVTVEIEYKEDISSYEISPKKLEMTGTVEGNKLTIELDKDEYLIIKINGNERRLVLLSDPWEEDAPDSSGEGIFNVYTDYEADRTGTNLATDKIQKAIDDASAYGTENGTRGIVYVPIGVYQISTLDLKSNVELYLEGGAALRLTLDDSQYRKRGFKNSIGKPVLHMLHTYNNTAGDPYDGNDTWYQETYQNPDNWIESVNIKIHGRGTIDGRGEEVDALGWLSETLVPQNCQNFISDGIIYRESGVWSINVMHSNDLEFTNLKVLNKIFHENDCIDINNSQNVVVRNAFGSALDDPYSTKNWETGELFQSVCGSGKILKNVLFEDCIAWTCCYGFKVGQGSWYTQDEVTFKDGVVYDCSVGIGVERKYGSAELKNITFENIDIEHVGNSNGPLRNWLAFQSINGAVEGIDPISDVAVKNIKVYDLGTNESRIIGFDQNNLINGISFEDIYIDDLKRNATTLEEMNIKERYLYAENITIDGNSVEDAPAPVTYVFENVLDSAEKSGDWAVGAGGGYVYAGQAVGDWIAFPITVEEPGTYELAVVMKHHDKKGIFQTYVNGEKVGEPYDQYGTNQEKTSVKMGEVTFEKAGEQIVKFEIVGKNEKSGSYQIVLNGVSLTFKEALHIHSYDTEWKTDDVEHWYECSCGESSETAEHVAGNWIVDVAATETTTGSKHKECITCGYKMETADIPKVSESDSNQRNSNNSSTTDNSTGTNTSESNASSRNNVSETSKPTEVYMNPGTTNVKTGDSANMVLWAAILIVAVGGLVGVTGYKKIKK